MAQPNERKVPHCTTIKSQILAAASPAPRTYCQRGGKLTHTKLQSADIFMAKIVCGSSSSFRSCMQRLKSFLLYILMWTSYKWNAIPHLIGQSGSLMTSSAST
eukprot:scaffold987_cov183-Amphora_coffeaeformis.AAC.5